MDRSRWLCGSGGDRLSGSVTFALCQVLLAIVPPAAAAQDAAAAPLVDASAVQRAMLRAFRAAEDPAAHGFADLAAVSTELDRVRAHLGLLPEERLAQGQFFVDVRRADVLLRRSRLDDAATVLQQAIVAARAAGCWRGSYRALALVLFEQCAPTESSLALLDAEAEYLESGAAQTDASYLSVPLRLLAAELAFHQGRDRVGLQRLQELVDEVLEALPRADAWRCKAVAGMAWQCVLRADLDRAELYLAQLPVDQQRYPRGLLALRRGDLELAEKAGRALIRQGSKVAGWQLVGESLERAQRFDGAEEAFAQVRELATDPVDRAIAERSLGDCALGRAEALGVQSERRDEWLAQARAAFERARQRLVGAAHAGSEQVGVLARLGRCAELRGETERAARAYEDALTAAAAVRSSLASDVFGGFWMGDEDRLQAVDGILRIAASGALSHARAFAAVEQGLARTLLDWTAEPPRRDSELERAVVSLVLDSRARGLEARRQRLEAARRQTQLVGGQGGVPALDLASIERRFDGRDGIVRVSWWAGSDEVFVLWDDGRGAGAVRSLGGRTALLDRLGEARRAVVDTRLELRAAEDALVAAAAAFLPVELRASIRRAERVVATLDAEVAGLPLEALPLEVRPLQSGSPEQASPERPLGADRSRRSEGTWLAEAALGCACVLERAPSLSVRAVLGDRAPRGRAVLMLDSARHAETEAAYGLAPLQFAPREAALLERAYGGRVERVSRSNASREGLATALAAADYDLVHICAHAVEDPRVPTASLLALTDGPAAVPALCALPLRGAFVVLSACSSAVGTAVRGGEGALALLAWPCAAGGRGAAAALWPVGQQATADLLGRFHYERAQLGEADEAEAMRRARVALASAPQYAHPHHWAGFGVYSGERASERDFNASDTGVAAALGSRSWLAGLALLGGLLASWIALRPRRNGSVPGE